MNHFKIRDVVQSPNQCAVIRWFGTAEGIDLVGLESIGTPLTGYTDGTCPVDNRRYFECIPGLGYYVIKNDFLEFYKVIDNEEAPFEGLSMNDESVYDDAYRSQAATLQASSRQSRSFQNYRNNSSNSMSSGILNRLTANNRVNNQHIQTSSNRHYQQRDENSLGDLNIVTQRNQLTPDRTASAIQNRDTDQSINSNHRYRYDSKEESFLPHESSFWKREPRIGAAYFLDDWTFQQAKNFVEKEITSQNRLFLNFTSDQRVVQQLIDEQINASGSYYPQTPPKHIAVELIRLFDNVRSIFPSRVIRLRDNDYMLLTILCSNGRCAYIRTSAGWAYVDEDMQNPTSDMISKHVSLMINDNTNNFQHRSEQCQHLLKNGSMLYYKLVE